jgi:TRAP-type C4-dicarboxylate transport system permease small subunit
VTDRKSERKSRTGGARFPEHVLVRIAGSIGALMILGVVGIIVTDVFMRRFSDTPLQGMTGIAQMATVIAVYLGMGEALRREQHVSVGLVVVRLSHRVGEVVSWVRSVIVIGLSLYFAYGAYLSTRSSYTRKEVIAGAIDLTIWPGRAAVVVGSSLLALAMFERVLRRDMRIIHEKSGLGAQ